MESAPIYELAIFHFDELSVHYGHFVDRQTAIEQAICVLGDEMIHLKRLNNLGLLKGQQFQVNLFPENDVEWEARSISTRVAVLKAGVIKM